GVGDNGRADRIAAPRAQKLSASHPSTRGRRRASPFALRDRRSRINSGMMDLICKIIMPVAR
ncbi:hypothetical protein ACO1MT_15010, partial [Staphylococcus aureus]